MPEKIRLMLGMFHILPPIATKFLFSFLALRIILMEKDGLVYYLACAHQLFYTYFEYVLHCSKHTF